MAPFKEHVPLAPYSHYKIGGPARYFFTARNERALARALAEARRRKLAIFIIGGATNLLIPDRGLDGLVVRCAVKGLRREGNRIVSGAGVAMADLLRFAAKEKLSGLEWAGGLPGTLGGAIRGNAGCFGGETKDAIASVKSIDLKTLRITTRRRAACRFGYRSSIYKEHEGREMVLSATFALKKGDARTIRREGHARIAWRKQRHPLEYPNIGSIFKNIPLGKIPKRWMADIGQNPKMDPFPVVPAARIISRLKLGGTRRGGAMISTKHTNFIVNVRRARARDVIHLIRLVQRKTKKKYGIAMEPEVQIL